MHFSSGQPMQFCSGVDTLPDGVDLPIAPATDG
jgi:hypothetical protein